MIDLFILLIRLLHGSDNKPFREYLAIFALIPYLALPERLVARLTSDVVHQSGVLQLRNFYSMEKLQLNT